MESKDFDINSWTKKNFSNLRQEEMTKKLKKINAENRMKLLEFIEKSKKNNLEDIKIINNNINYTSVFQLYNNNIPNLPNNYLINNLTNEFNPINTQNNFQYNSNINGLNGNINLQNKGLPMYNSNIIYFCPSIISK